MKLFPYKWYLNYCFFWILLSVIYFVLLFTVYFDTDKFPSFLGLFVPIGPFSLLYAIGAPLGGLMFIFSLIFSDILAFRVLGIRKVFTKIIFNLYLLLLITCFVDTVGTNSWYSLMLFLDQTPWGSDSWAQKQYDLFAQQYHIPLLTNLVLISILVIIGLALIKNIRKSQSFFIKDNQ